MSQYQILSTIILSFTKIACLMTQLWISKNWCDNNLRHLFGSLNVSTCWKSVSRIVLIKNTYIETLFNMLKVTAAKLSWKTRMKSIPCVLLTVLLNRYCYWYQDVTSSESQEIMKNTIFPINNTTRFFQRVNFYSARPYAKNITWTS